MMGAKTVFLLFLSVTIIKRVPAPYSGPYFVWPLTQDYDVIEVLKNTQQNFEQCNQKFTQMVNDSLALTFDGTYSLDLQVDNFGGGDFSFGFFLYFSEVPLDLRTVFSYKPTDESTADSFTLLEYTVNVEPSPSMHLQLMMRFKDEGWLLSDFYLIALSPNMPYFVLLSEDVSKPKTRLTLLDIDSDVITLQEVDLSSFVSNTPVSLLTPGTLRLGTYNDTTEFFRGAIHCLALFDSRPNNDFLLASSECRDKTWSFQPPANTNRELLCQINTIKNMSSCVGTDKQRCADFMLVNTTSGNVPPLATISLATTTEQGISTLECSSLCLYQEECQSFKIKGNTCVTYNETHIQGLILDPTAMYFIKIS